MKRHWKQALVTLGSTLGSLVLAALLRSDDPHDQPQPPAAEQRLAQRPQPRGLRGHIVDMVSDVLAETYRKVREQQERQR